MILQNMNYKILLPSKTDAADLFVKDFFIHWNIKIHNHSSWHIKIQGNGNEIRNQSSNPG